MWNSPQREKFNFYFLFFIFLVLRKLSFWQGNWALGYHSMMFRQIPDISEFPKILSLKSLGNSWGNSYIPCLLVIIAHRFHLWKYTKRVLSIKIRKSEHHHWILHVRISVGTKFQLLLMILIFLTKSGQKGYFHSKTKKVNSIIEFWIFELG